MSADATCGGGCTPGPAEPAGNPPGRDRLDFRAGTHTQLRQRAIEQLSLLELEDSGRRPLAALTTRGSDDPAIAWIDGFAVMGDVLTFYSERIANEGYLRCATERRSVLELARSIGYELSPGVAASVLLAFSVETAEGSPEKATVPTGTPVKSIPGEGELPQTFETVEAIEARAQWNEIPLRRTRPQILGLRAKDGSPALHLYEFDGSLEGVTDTIVVAPPGGAGGGTDWRDSEFLLAGDDTFVAMDRSPWGVRAVPIPAVYVGGKAAIEVGDRLLFAGRSYKGATSDGKREFETLILVVEAVDYEAGHDRTRIRLGSGKLPSYGLVIFQMALTYGLTMAGGGILSESGLQFLLTGGTLGLGLGAAPLPPVSAEVGLFAFAERLSFYGHNAPRWATLPKWEAGTREGTTNPYGAPWDDAEIWTTSQGTELTDAGHRADAYLERAVGQIGVGSWVVLENDSATRVPFRVAGTLERSLSDYAMSGKTTGLVLQDAQGEDLQSDDKDSSFRVRRTTAHVVSERQSLSDLPIEDDVDPLDDRLLLDGLVEGLRIGRPVIVRGETRERPGESVSCILTISEIQHVISKVENGLAVDGFTTLRFQTAVGWTFLLASTRVLANVALATHGETTSQVLGDGDGAEPNQGFALTGLPLTYVSSTSPSGRDTTLAVRVNGLLWKEAPTLYGHTANDTRYAVRHEDDGSTTVAFGDGLSGARLPSGSQNVTAVHRKGIGLDGEVDAGSLSLMPRRPLGIHGVANPLAASGAEDAESLDDARSNAPLRVLTLDRIVSLRDYEDFAGGFAGIGKASAVSLWHGEREIVHITVASASGKLVDDRLLENLRGAITAAHDPGATFLLSNFRERLFDVHAVLLLDPRFEAARVLEAARSAMRADFSFPRRAFAAPVTAAEVITLLDGVAGVVAVDLESLSSGSVSSAVFLDADGPVEAGGLFLGAELLLVSTAGIRLEEKER